MLVNKNPAHLNAAQQNTLQQIDAKVQAEQTAQANGADKATVDKLKGDAVSTFADSAHVKMPAGLRRALAGGMAARFSAGDVASALKNGTSAKDPSLSQAMSSGYQTFLLNAGKKDSPASREHFSRLMHKDLADHGVPTADIDTLVQGGFSQENKIKLADLIKHHGTKA